MILLDTNVISEALRPAPLPSVVSWLNANHANAAISSITIFELEAGAGMLEAGRRKDALENAIARTVRRFGGRVYAFDAAAAQAAARLLVRARAQGLGLHQIPNKLANLHIAGVALAYGLELATRNVGDFTGLGIGLIDPWDGG
jgi:predicted nucleic acid-binding protein